MMDLLHRVDRAIWHSSAGDLACSVLVVLAIAGMIVEIAAHFLFTT